MRTLLNSWKDRFTRTKSARAENARHSKSPTHRGLRLEPLEERQLLAVIAEVPPGETELTITGDSVLGSTDDDIRVTMDNGAVKVESHGTTHSTHTGVNSIVINADDGDDKVTIDVTLPSSIPVTINGGLGKDILNGGLGNDTIYGNDGDDIIKGSHGNDTIYGGSGEDEIWGHNGNDIIDGGSDGDTINGGPNNDTIRGGAGNDTYVFLGSNLGEDELYEDSNEGCDTLDFTGMSHGITLNLGETDAYQSVNDHLQLKLLSSSSSYHFERVLGSVYGDTITGGGANDYINGVHGNDTLYGGPGNDELIGHQGADRIYGEAGNDTLKGGLGDDEYVFSGSTALGFDTLLESDGNGTDTLDFRHFTAEGIAIDISDGTTTQNVASTLAIQLNVSVPSVASCTA